MIGMYECMAGNVKKLPCLTYAEVSGKDAACEALEFMFHSGECHFSQALSSFVLFVVFIWLLEIND